MSPERVGFCLKYTEEIRHLTKSHHNHEDKLQVGFLFVHLVIALFGSNMFIRI